MIVVGMCAIQSKSPRQLALSSPSQKWESAVGLVQSKAANVPVHTIAENGRIRTFKAAK